MRINFRGNSEIHENSEIYCPRKISDIAMVLRFNNCLRDKLYS